MMKSKYPLSRKTPLGNPQFMGLENGDKTIQQVRNEIKRQQRLKGFSLSAITGSSDHNIDLSGTARMMLGLAFVTDPALSVGTTAEKVSFIVNNEIIIDQVNFEFLGSEFTDKEFYQILRPLSGTDDIKVVITNSNPTQQVEMVIYYL